MRRARRLGLIGTATVAGLGFRALWVSRGNRIGPSDPAVLPACPPADVSTSESNGLTMTTYQDWNVRTGVRGYVWHAPVPRAALLLQHGFGEYSQRYVASYERLIPRLLDIGFSVYAIDLIGHGRSLGTRGVLDAERAVADHLAARRVLRAQPMPVFLFGHSLGGLVTASSAARDPEGIAGVVLSSAMLGRRLPRFVPPLARWLGLALPDLPLVDLPLSGLSHIEAVKADFLRDPLIFHGRMPFLLAGSMVAAAQKNWKLYHSWTTPTLLIHGTDDSFTDPEFSRRVYEAIASTDKTIHLVEGGRHELLNDTDRVETLHLLTDWLERQFTAADQAGVSRT